MAKGKMSRRREEFLAARRREREDGFIYVLPNASITDGEPFEVRLRRISVQEKAAVNGISQEVQEDVYRRTRRLSEWQAEQQRKKIKPADQLEALKQSQPLIDSINAICCAAWIEPQLVETEAELASNPDAWHVDDFSVDDRWSAFQAITNGDSEEAKTLRLFRPESGTDAPDSRALPDAAPAERSS